VVKGIFAGINKSAYTFQEITLNISRVRVNDGGFEKVTELTVKMILQ
jgi:hypothetical protein